MEMAVGFVIFEEKPTGQCLFGERIRLSAKKAATQTGLYLAARRGILPVNGKEFKNGGFATNTAKAPSAKGG